MRGLVDCWTIWITNTILYCPMYIPLGRRDFLYILRPVSPTNVYGPSDLRTHVHPQRLRRRVGKSCRCTIRPAHSPYCQPLDSGTVQHRAAVTCRLAFVALRVRGMVGCSSRYACVKFRLIPMSTQRVADATPHSTPTEEQRSTMRERDNEQRTLTTL